MGKNIPFTLLAELPTKTFRIQYELNPFTFLTEPPSRTWLGKNQIQNASLGQLDAPESL